MLNIKEPNNPDLRRCPYCAELIQLRRCPIVAREFIAGGVGVAPFAVDESPYADDGFLTPFLDPDDGDGPDTEQAPSIPTAAPPPFRGSEMFGGHPVLVSAPDVERAFMASDGRLVPTAELAPRRDSPARACPECTNLLPEDLDDRDVYVIGVVGTQGSGKTHYIATAMTEACNGAGLEAFGYRRFRTAETSEDAFYSEYYAPVYQNASALAKTQMSELVDGKLAPLVFRFEIDEDQPRSVLDRLRNPNSGSRKVSVLVHDLPGEALREPAKRRKYAAILHHADALIFLVDAMSFPRVRASANTLHPDAGLNAEDLGFSQAGLINALADELGDAVAAAIPVSVAVTKADLVLEAVSTQHTFASPTPADPTAHFEQISDISGEVRELIGGELGDLALARAAGAFPRATYHSIASLGSQPDKAAGIPELKPIRCLDPLISALTRVTWPTSGR